ncbi:hypothetical protein [Niabella drilacis]|uniref:Uncharacterized protein n=1 Tax=Niabella drilacis (strain DSM 25811 / CCM 8410 / CCUG 62505 / LMG 26954 / E90) TaxID=1285928 RepID=A0A1G6N5C4_NIADE|nr:hypothetical protein [Niabella drilacis]SDC62335.1 hypothetical protein SAMN04487894_103137 [Niabella drilacis]
MNKPIGALLIFTLALTGSLFAQPADSLAKQLKGAQEQVAMVNAIFKPPAQYRQIPKGRSGYWGLGNFEEAAFVKDDIVMVVFSTSWFAAPPAFMRSPNYEPAVWVRNMNNRFDSMARSNADPGFACTPVAIPELRKINANRGYIFNKNPNPSTPYRSVYSRAKLLFLQKDDLGRILLVYYYRPKDEKKVLREIRKQWGMITFKDDKSFYRDQSRGIGQKTIYLGKFAYANTPEERRNDSLLFEKRRQQRQKSGLQR